MKATGLPATEDVAALVDELRNKGTVLWTENGQLRYRVRRNALSSADMQRLGYLKESIVRFLNVAGQGERERGYHWVRSGEPYVPLGFSQLWHWEMFRRMQRLSGRTTASVVRLRGYLDVSSLRQGVAALVRQHESLRTRLALVGDGVMQVILEKDECFLHCDDLSGLAEDARETKARLLIERFVGALIDPIVDPLFEARLIKISEQEHLLILATDHMISDAFSLRILLRDLFSAYAKIVGGESVPLAPIALRFTDYCAWQRELERRWVSEHGQYWQERITGWRDLRFPAEVKAGKESGGWGAVPIRICRHVKTELREWCRARRTTLAMCVLTAYVSLVSRWSGRQEVLIQYQTNGRASPRLQATVGYFASLLGLRIRLWDYESFDDLLHRVTDEYCQAFEHGDLSYIATQISHREFVPNTVFNWVPHDLGSLERKVETISGLISVSPVHVETDGLDNVIGDNDPEVILFDTREEIVGKIVFPRSRFEAASMERLGACLVDTLQSLPECAHSPLSEIENLDLKTCSKCNGTDV